MTWYAAMYSSAIVGALLVIWMDSRRVERPAGRWAIVLVAWAIGGMVGAELPHDLFGDLVAARTAVGAVAGATIALFLASIALRLDGLKALDTTAVAIPIGGAIARLGCFVAECCEGVATGLPVGIIGEDGVRRHPTQLYEAAFDLAVAAWLTRSTKRRIDGHRFLVSLAAMSAGRFMIEFVRDSDKIGPLSLAQWITGPAAIAAIVIVAKRIELPRPRRRTMAVTVLALQMPVISADTLYPRNYISGGAAWFGSSFDWVHDVGSCDVRESYKRTHKLGGAAAEVGYRRQLSSTRGFGFRLRPFSATENASETRDYKIQGQPPSFAWMPQPAYTVRHRGATVAADIDFKYLGLTIGGTFGQFYPLLDAADDYPGYRTVQEQWPAMGLRLGTQRVALEIRAGDEAPTGAPLPAFTVGLGIGDGKATRVRIGTSDMGPFIAFRHVLPFGLEIDPMFGGAHQGWLGGVMVKQWFRVDPKTR